LIALSDHTEKSGGFHCIPGFTHYWNAWSENQEDANYTDCLIDLPRKDPAHKFVKKITMRPGSLLIWDSRTPHGNYPNEGSQFRMVQYLTFFPAQHDLQTQRKQLMTHALDKVALSDLGKKVTALLPYPTSEVSAPSTESEFNEQQWGL